jgi:hypothetical protein
MSQKCPVPKSGDWSALPYRDEDESDSRCSNQTDEDITGKPKILAWENAQVEEEHRLLIEGNCELVRNLSTVKPLSRLKKGQLVMDDSAKDRRRDAYPERHDGFLVGEILFMFSISVHDG